MSEHSLRVLLSENQIRARVREMAARIDADYPDGVLCLIGVLKGSCIFLSDLVRAIHRPVRFDFIGASSYGTGKASSGSVQITKDVEMPLEGCDVLLVEDIVDTGITLTHLLRRVERHRPKSVRVAALLDKPERHQRPVDITYLGFSIPDRFVVGYGLDYAEDYRGLRDICLLD